METQSLIPSKRKGTGKSPKAKKKRKSAKKNTRMTVSVQSMKPSKVCDAAPSVASSSKGGGFARIGRKVLLCQRTARKLQKETWSRKVESRYWKGLEGSKLEKKKLDLKGALKQLQMDERSHFYRQLVVYTVFLFSLFIFLLHIPVGESYQQTDAVSNILCTGNEAAPCQVETLTDVYSFIEHLGQELCGWKDGQSDLKQWHRLGSVTLRQVKSREKSCVMGAKEYMCHPEYSSEAEQTSSFQGKSTGTIYHWRDDLPPLRSRHLISLFSTQVIEYGTSGYALDLCSDPLIVDKLRQDQWIDLDTRAVSLDFQLVNPSTKFFTVGHHVLKINSFGGIQHTPLGGSFRLFMPSLEPSDNRMALWGLTVSVFLAVYLADEFRRIESQGTRIWLSNPWNVISFVQITVLYALMYTVVRFNIEGVEISRIAMNQDIRSPYAKAMNNGLFLYNTMLDWAALLNFFWQVIHLVSRDILGFLVISSFVLVSFSIIGFIVFGNTLEEFSSPIAAFRTCLELLFTRMDFYRLREANPRLFPVFMGAYVLTALLLMVYFTIAVLIQHWKEAKKLSEASDVEYDIVRRIRTKFHSFTPYVIMNEENNVIELVSGRQVNLISSNILDQEMKRINARKRFRCAVWRILALMRFGVKFDTFLKVGHVHTWIASKPIVRTLDIRLSSNFDHKTIKKMLPVDATIHIKRDGAPGRGIPLRVVRHCNMYTECVVGEFDDHKELTGGERLQIPKIAFFLYLLQTTVEYTVTALVAAIFGRTRKQAILFSDQKLAEMLQEGLDEGHSSLRYDEMYRKIELLIRRDTFMNISACEIGKQTALIILKFPDALFDMPSREKEGHNYIPNPHDTSKVDLPALEPLVELLAKNCHDLWAKARLESGWKWGRARDDESKLHPNLVPYEALLSSEKDYDRRTAVETLKTIYILHFHILSPKGPIDKVKWDIKELKWPESRSSTLYTVYHGDKVYRPDPIDASDVVLPSRLHSLAHLLAENTHEVWSVGRMKDGWTYGPKRDDRRKKHPCLVPYVFLTSEEKEYDLNTAMGTLQTLLVVGFQIQDCTPIKS